MTTEIQRLIKPFEPFTRTRFISTERLQLNRKKTRWVRSTPLIQNTFNLTTMTHSNNNQINRRQVALPFSNIMSSPHFDEQPNKTKTNHENESIVESHECSSLSTTDHHQKKQIYHRKPTIRRRSFWQSLSCTKIN